MSIKNSKFKVEQKVYSIVQKGKKRGVIKRRTYLKDSCVYVFKPKV